MALLKNTVGVLIILVLLTIPRVTWGEDASNLGIDDNTSHSYSMYALPNSVISPHYSSLPKVLSQNDTKTYYEIFKAQSIGDFATANRLIGRLEDNTLLGYVYYMRYESKYYRSRPNELIKWLHSYYNLPVAKNIYHLLQIKTGYKNPKGAKTPLFLGGVKPIYVNDDFMNQSVESSLPNHKIPEIYPRRSKLASQINRYIKRGQTLLAKKALSNKVNLKNLGYQTYYYYAAKLSERYFFDKEFSLSIYWGEKVASSYYGKYSPGVYFILGLSYYCIEAYSSSFKNFQFIADHANWYDSELVSKASYWAAKDSLILKKYQDYYSYLLETAHYKYNFYGFIAQEELGVYNTYNINKIQVPLASVDYLKNSMFGHRALALMQFGLVNWAGQELILLTKYTLPTLDDASRNAYSRGLIYLSQNIPMPMLSIALAGVRGKYYGLLDMAYPLVIFDNSRNLADNLMTLALIKSESNFNSNIISAAGAVGMMQVMPSTAKHLIRLAHYQSKLNYYYNVSHLLLNPNYNVHLGAIYFDQILNSSIADGNIIYALASWNAGMGNVKYWERTRGYSGNDNNDSLLFMESIPFKETRHFIQKVLTNYWLYKVIYKGGDLNLAKDIAMNQPPIYNNDSVKLDEEGHHWLTNSYVVYTDKVSYPQMIRFDISDQEDNSSQSEAMSVEESKKGVTERVVAHQD